MSGSREGAPYSVRARVGATRTPEQAERALVQIYGRGGVMRLGDQLFIQPPGETRMRPYNPPGPDIGDVASVAAPVAGNMLGGAAGAALGAAVGGPVGGILGGAAGSTAGEEIANRILSPVPDDRPAGAQALDAGVSFGAGVAMPGIVRAGQDLLGGAMSRLVSRRGSSVAPEARALEIPNLPAGTMAGSGALNSLERGMEQAVLGRGVINRAWQTANDQADAAMDRITRLATGGRAAPSGPGPRMEFTQGAAGRAAESFPGGIVQRTNAASAAFGPQPVPLNSVQGLLNTLRSEASGAEASLAPRYQEAVRRAETLLRDAEANGGIDARTLLQVRTTLNDITRYGVEGQQNPTANAPLQRLVGALGEDLRAATQGRPYAGPALDNLDTFIAGGRDRATGYMSPLERLQMPAEPGGFRVGSLVERPDELRRVMVGLRNGATPADADLLRGSIIRDMGRPPPSAQGAEEGGFSFASFLTNYARARETGSLDHLAAAGTQERRMLDMMARVAENARMSTAARNTSNSGGAVGLNLGLGAVGAGVGTMLEGGNFVPLVLGVLGATAPAYVSRLLVNPRFANWIARGESITDPQALSMHLARLSTMTLPDPDLQAGLDYVRTALGVRPAGASEPEQQGPQMPPGILSGPPVPPEEIRLPLAD